TLVSEQRTSIVSTRRPGEPSLIFYCLHGNTVNNAPRHQVACDAKGPAPRQKPFSVSLVSGNPPFHLLPWLDILVYPCSIGHLVTRFLESSCVMKVKPQS